MCSTLLLLLLLCACPWWCLCACVCPCSQSLPVLKACGVAVQVVCDVGLGRWVKLLNARSTAHTRLKQYELKQILDLSEQVRG